jgi:cell division protein FtsB
VKTIALRRPRLSMGYAPQIVAVLLVLGLAGAMAIQPTRQLLAQRQRIAQMTDQLQDTRGANARLAEYVERLKDPDYLEQRARAQLGLVRPGETSFVVMPPSKKRSRHHRQRAGEGREREARDPSFLQRLLEFVGFV